jgi:hypothetical protein
LGSSDTAATNNVEPRSRRRWPLLTPRAIHRDISIDYKIIPKLIPIAGFRTMM